MPLTLFHIKPCKNLISVLDFINSIALSTDVYIEDDDKNGDYTLLLYKSSKLNKYLTIGYSSTCANMNVTVQEGESLNLNVPFKQVLDSKTVKQEFQSLLNSNKEWTFRQSFQIKNYAMGFYNDAVAIYKWDILSDINDLLGIKLLVKHDNESDISDLETVLRDVIYEDDASANSLEVYRDVDINRNDVSLHVLKMVL